MLRGDGPDPDLRSSWRRRLFSRTRALLGNVKNEEIVLNTLQSASDLRHVRMLPRSSLQQKYSTSVVFGALQFCALVTFSLLYCAGAAQGQERNSLSFSTSDLLISDRFTLWNPGLLGGGGIPERSTICARIEAALFGDGAQDASAAIQEAINSCPIGQTVQLSDGAFLANSYLLIWKSITLRGAGAGRTVLHKTNGAKWNQWNPADAQPNIIIGPSRWPKLDDQAVQNLAGDGHKGTYSVTVRDGRRFEVGQIVLLDELSGASWQPSRLGQGQVWASPDYRVVWRLHNPAQSGDDPILPTTPTSGPAASWFSRQDRVTAEMKEIAAVEGNVVTFTTPLHIQYRAAHEAQLTPPAAKHVRLAGVEELTVKGGSNGAVRFESAAYSWMKAVEVTEWLGEGVAVNNSFRVEVRDSYIHDGVWAQPGGGGYAISLATASAEALFENNIITMANKLMVARSAGAGSVFGYNYADKGYINTNEHWIEVGLNASHMVGPHHVLFEGNYGFNWDSDHTHGNSIYHTVFRNHLRCIRAPFQNPLSGNAVNDASQARNGPRRCIGATAYSYWMSFMGNVLGAPNQMKGWTYDVTGPRGMTIPAVWLLGWADASPQPYDPFTKETAFRHGNFDYLTNSTQWNSQVADQSLPDSLYLSKKPDFFTRGRGYAWPWIDPTGGAKTYALPAKVRHDAGTPFVQP